MRVLLIGNYAHDAQASMNGFRALLERGLTAREVSVSVLAPQPWLGRFKPGSSGLGKWLGYLDKYALFPITLRRFLRKMRGEPVVVHLCDHGNAIYTHFLQDTAHLVTCHDLLAIRQAHGEFPGHELSRTGRVYQKLISRGLRAARLVVCVSEATRSDFTRIFPEAVREVPVIPVALDPIFLKEETPEPTTDRWILHLSNGAWYKNVPGVLRLYAAALRRQPDLPRLIFAGSGDWTSFHPLARELDVTPEWLGSLDRADVVRLYRGARALLFPSHAEGFGWPILEAQASGCPVITSAAEPMRSVGGAAAVTIPPDDPEAGASALLALLSENPEARETRRREGRRNAESYTEARTIEAYLAEYERLLACS